MGTIEKDEEKSKVGWRHFWPAALFLLLLLPAALCAQSLLLIFNGCNDLVHYYQPVDVTSLLNLRIPADVELSDAGFKFTPAIPTIEDEAVWIGARRMSSLESARFEFDRLCERWPGDYSYGGDGDQRYCISHVRTDRADPAGLCGRLGHYSSHVVIQNQDLIFSISERSPDKKSQAKDEAIRQFAHELETAIAAQTYPPVDPALAAYYQYGCGSCHSFDGLAGVGPTWLGLFGSKVVLADSTAVTADTDYLHRSILEPEVQLVAGYANVMPTSYGQQLPETEMTELIDLIQLLVKAAK